MNSDAFYIAIITGGHIFGKGGICKERLYPESSGYSLFTIHWKMILYFFTATSCANLAMDMVCR